MRQRFTLRSVLWSFTASAVLASAVALSVYLYNGFNLPFIFYAGMPELFGFNISFLPATLGVLPSIFLNGLLFFWVLFFIVSVITGIGRSLLKEITTEQNAELTVLQQGRFFQKSIDPRILLVIGATFLIFPFTILGSLSSPISSPDVYSAVILISPLIGVVMLFSGVLGIIKRPR